MKRMFKTALCLTASLLMASSAFAATVELYSLDGRTIEVEDFQVDLYTEEGMGWFKEKPVTMYSRDGRTIVVPADRVEAQKLVGWFVQDEATVPTQPTQPAEPTQPVTPPDAGNTTGKTAIRYTDGTVINVPSHEVDMYKVLGWVVADSASDVPQTSTVTVYNAEGNSIVINASELEKYKLEGWSEVKPDGGLITVYDHNGTEKQVSSTEVESLKAQGWYPAYDEAVYAYAAFGNGEVTGATKLLEGKSYEAAFLMVQEAIDKLENTSSEYVTLLYYLRTSVTDAWREAANSPLGFINYWFSEKDGNNLVVFEYRNVSNNRIQSFRINFDICNANGEVVETNSGSYYVDKLQMAPCEKKRVAWVIGSKDAASIKNLKVKEVVFSDGTKWNVAE